METGGAERSTFLPLGEVLNHVLEAARVVRVQIETMPIPNDERLSLFIRQLVTRRREFEEAIRACVEEMPAGEEVFVQYAVDPDRLRADPPPPLSDETSTSSLLEWLVSRDRSISAVLLELAARVQKPSARERLESLVYLLGAEGQRVARSHQQLHDI